MSALQSQTYANTGDAYYIQAGVPIVPGDTAIIGPIEIAPALSEGTAVYYNRFIQTNANGLQISENRTAGNVLLSDIKLTSDPIFSPSIVLSTYSPTAQRASLSISPENSQGLIKVRADAGLVVADKSASGTSLQIFHDPANNRNTIRNYQSSGAELNFEGNTGEIKITSPLSASSILAPSTAEYILISNNGSPLKTNQLLNNGIVINEGSTYGGRLGTLGGTGMTLDSKTNITLRTNYGGSPLTNITCNTDGSVTFLNTITASIGNFLTSITAPIVNSTTINNAGTIATAIINAVSGTIGTLNSTTGNITTVNSTTVNSTTINNTGLTTTGTLTVNTSASIPAITNLASINSIPIYNFFTPTGCVIPFAGLSASLPQGYLLCNGQTVSQTTYSVLYGIIGDNFNISGASPAGQFALPDLRTKTAIGASNPGSWGNFTFNVTGGTFDTLSGSVPPSPYVARQCIYVSDTANGFFVTKGQTLTFGAETKNIVGVINTTGSDQITGLTNAYVIVLDSALSVSISGGTLIQINDTNDTCNMGKTRYGNLTIQNGNEVGIHTHGSVATGSSANAGAANQRSEPTFSQPINQPNGNYTGNNGTVYTLPFSMNTMPSAVFMNYIIKY